MFWARSCRQGFKWRNYFKTIDYYFNNERHYLPKSKINETLRNQLDALDQKVVNGEELNELQKQLRSELRSELSALQQG